MIIKMLSRTALLSPVLLFMIVFQSPQLYATVSDYDPLTGEPKCIYCHPRNKKLSIDYSRDSSCFECHSTGLSDKFMAIDLRYKKDVVAYKPIASDDNVHPHPNSPPSRGRETEESDKFSSSSVPQQGLSASSDNMVYVPTGEFTMGSNEWWPKSQPEHKRVLKAFLIDKFEVTNKLYKINSLTPFIQHLIQHPLHT